MAERSNEIDNIDVPLPLSPSNERLSVLRQRIRELENKNPKDPNLRILREEIFDIIDSQARNNPLLNQFEPQLKIQSEQIQPPESIPNQLDKLVSPISFVSRKQINSLKKSYKKFKTAVRFDSNGYQYFIKDGEDREDNRRSYGIKAKYPSQPGARRLCLMPLDSGITDNLRIKCKLCLNMFDNTKQCYKHITSFHGLGIPKD